MTMTTTPPPTTLSHAEAFDRLGEYAFDELAAGDRAPIEAHLEGCADCRRELARLRAARTAVSSLARVPAPADFDGAVASTIRRRSRGRFFGDRDGWERLPFVTLSFVTLAILALILLLAWHSSGRGAGEGPARPATPAAPPPPPPPPLVP